MDRAQIPVETTAGVKLWQARAESAFERLWNVSPPKIMTEGMSHAARLRKRWKIKQRAKRRAVKWIAEQLGVSAPDFTFADLDGEECKRAIELCRGMDLQKVRTWSKERGQ